MSNDNFNVQLDKEARQWAMSCHLGGLAGFIFPLGNIIVPWILWLLRRDDYNFVDTQGKEALNFQISISLYSIAAWVLIVILIGKLLLLILAIANVVLIIMAAIQVNQGKDYHYPFTIRFLK